MSEGWASDYFEHGYARRWDLAAPSDPVRLEARGIWNILQLSHLSRVVDIGCGHGKHALALADCGARVVGVDFAANLLSRARHLGHELRTDARWIRGDMRRLPLQDECADAALIIDAFGFFETEDEHEAVLREARRILRRRGSLMMKVVNGVPLLADFRATELEQRGGVEVLISNTLTLDPPRLTQRLRVSGDRGPGTYERRQRLYRMDELHGLLEHAGFTVSGVFAKTDGAPFIATESSAIWIAAQPSA